MWMLEEWVSISLMQGCQTNFAPGATFVLQRGLEGSFENGLYFLAIKIGKIICPLIY